jgi:putative phage-type endonuclease
MEEFDNIVKLYESSLSTSLNDEIEFTDAELSAIEEMALELIHEHIDGNALQFSNPDFMENLLNDIAELLVNDLHEPFSEKHNKDTIYDTIAEIVEDTVTAFMEICDIVPRSECLVPTNKNRIKNVEQINKLKSVKQPDQRTEEWYRQRSELLTASSIWKVFASESQLNSLIYEKCQDPNQKKYTSMNNADNSLQWGIKYEPISIQIYEKKMQTKVEQFGCFIHQKYPFIGASPDGIITDPDSPKFGTMIEVKNIVNREITGIPIESYWIQMQIQMETCNLDECDFIETRIKEYTDNPPEKMDVSDNDSLIIRENKTPDEQFYADDNHEYKGVLLYFVPRTNSNEPLYEYSIINEKNETINWINKTKEQLNKTHILFQTKYWYLDEYSCVTVKRNQLWIEAAIPKIENVWKTIIEERKTGHTHRAPKTKTNSMVGVCHIQVTKLE